MLYYIEMENILMELIFTFLRHRVYSQSIVLLLLTVYVHLYSSRAIFSYSYAMLVYSPAVGENL